MSQLPAGTPAPLRALLARCLQKDRKQRLHDIGDASFELDAASAPQPPAATSVKPQPTWLAWAIAGALALALVAALFAPRDGTGRADHSEPVRLPLVVPEGFWLALDNQVNPIRIVDDQILVPNRQPNLALDDHGKLPQLKRETFLVCRLQEPRTEHAMHLDRGTDHLLAQVVEVIGVHLCGTLRVLCASAPLRSSK